MDAPGSAEAACKEQTRCLRLEGESPLLRIKKTRSVFLFFEAVAQLDRASDCGSEGRTFESYQLRRKLNLWRDARAVESGGLENR